MAPFAIREKDGLRFGYFPAWEKLGVGHAFTCRTGGESDNLEGILNMGLHSGDNPEKVVRNRQKVAKALGFDLNRTVTCNQVHSTRIVRVTEADAGKGAFTYEDTLPQTDGLITDCRNLPLLLVFADCVPILLVDTCSNAIGLVHAGWRGSVAGIAKKAVEQLAEAFGCQPHNLAVGIGPSIGPCCYEVDEAVRSQAEAYASCFTPGREGHYQLDLWKMNTLQLLEAGVPQEMIFRSDYCTCCHQGDFFSYRGEHGKTGRLAGILFRK